MKELEETWIFDKIRHADFWLVKADLSTLIPSIKTNLYNLIKSKKKIKETYTVLLSSSLLEAAHPVNLSEETVINR